MSRGFGGRDMQFRGSDMQVYAIMRNDMQQYAIM